MNATRIQVPVPLPEPHFEDEATVVSARQVVPLDQARNYDRRRKLLRILLMLLAAIFCGGLGAIAVNFFERRASVSTTVSQPSSAGAKDEQLQTVPGPSPDNGAITSAESMDKTWSNSQPSGAVANDSSANDSSGADSVENRSAKSAQVVASAEKPSSPSDPKQLVRQRRVHPPAAEPKSRGAARIQDIFSGPNP
jgi:cytoskeletal protein RodZ